jgi:hemerythrin
MKRFELTDDLLTGIADIDNQHRAILELGNRIMDPAAVKATGTEFEDAVSYLSTHVINHFIAEEFAMLQSGYPHYEHHRQWHDRFRQDVNGYAEQSRIEGMSKDLKLKISFALEKWLLEHVRIADRSLADYLKEEGHAGKVHLPSMESFKEKKQRPETFARRTAGAGPD